MGLKAYVPFTNARRERLFGVALQNRVGEHDGLAQIEWPDGNVTFKPVDYDDRQNQLVDPDEEFTVALKGLGAEPVEVAGVPVWTCEARNYGIISTQAALITDRERRGEDIYEGQDALEFLLWQYIEELWTFAENYYDEDDADLDVAADGGGAVAASRAAADLASERHDPSYQRFSEYLKDAPEDLTVYDLRPPEGVDAQVFSIRDVTEFDPFPVLREDASRAVDWATQAASDDDEWWSGFVTASVFWVFAYLAYRVIPMLIGWILGAVSGGGGGGPNIGLTILPKIGGLLPQVAGVIL